MKKWLIGLWASLASLHCGGQQVQPSGLVADPAFDKEIASLIDGEVPYISVEELYDQQSGYIILDAREKEEYRTSHLPGAIYIGYHSLDKAQLRDLPKDGKIAVYCSVGYRSEKIGKRLQDAGYRDVVNVYGSIFEWVNKGYPVIGEDGKQTKKIHTYNKKWSRWVSNEQAVKVW